jgi:microcompartment protein CcmL/EutN
LSDGLPDGLSELTRSLAPAIGLLEFDSIAAGIVAADAMVKASPVAALYSGTVHPGRYLVLVCGDTASVEIALQRGGTASLVDSLFLPNVDPAVVAAITTTSEAAPIDGDALGIVETSSAATAIVAADAGVKTAGVALLAVRLADDLGGKAYCLFGGDVADVEAAVEAAVEGAVRRTEHGQRLVSATVIPQLHPEIGANLAADLRFNHRLRRDPGAG